MTDETKNLPTVKPRPCQSLGASTGSATRDQAVRALLEEVIWWHSDPTLPDYNGCDNEPCMWCEHAKSLLAGTADYAEIVKIRPNVDV